MLAPIPGDILQNAQYRWREVFESLRSGECVWNQQVSALPLGSRVLVLFYRADLFERHQRKPPETWADYQELVASFSDRQALGDLAPPQDAPWSATCEPWGEGWAAITLLARAAAYARHPDYYGTLFNLHTMAPLIASAPFVRALDEMAAARGGGARPASDDPRLALSPHDAVVAIQQGHCALALGWLSGGAAAADQASTAPVSGGQAVSVAPLPGAIESFEQDKQKFVTTPLRRVPLLAVEGRVGALVSASKSQPAAAQLLAALTDEEWGGRMAQASAGGAPFRASHVKAAAAWAPQAEAELARQYVEAVRVSLASREVAFALRIPGRERYLAALDQGVRRVLRGEMTSQAALDAVAAQWQAITQELGTQSQQQAARASDRPQF
jgi:multiple sugar transport system substrate-binding protein